MDPNEKQYFIWLLRKCKVNLNTEVHKQLIAELDEVIKKLIGTHGDEIHRYVPDEEEIKNEQTESISQ